MTYNKETLKEAIVQKLRLNYGCTEQQATDREMMKACAMVLRDIMAEHGVQTCLLYTSPSPRDTR